MSLRNPLRRLARLREEAGMVRTREMKMRKESTRRDKLISVSHTLLPPLHGHSVTVHFCKTKNRGDLYW